MRKIFPFKLLELKQLETHLRRLEKTKNPETIYKIGHFDDFSSNPYVVLLFLGRLFYCEYLN